MERLTKRIVESCLIFLGAIWTDYFVYTTFIEESLNMVVQWSGLGIWLAHLAYAMCHYRED